MALLAATLLLGVAPSPAQVDLLQGEDPTLPGGMSGEVGLVIESVGFNNAARPGEWAGLRVRAFERGERQREVILRASIRDADGDTTQYETVITTNPGIDQPVWLYVRLPYDIEAVGFIRVQAFEAEETDGGAGFTEGRLLGQVYRTWQGLNTPTSAFIGVVGTTPPGLTGYEGASRGTVTQSTGERIFNNPLGHEISQIVNMRPEALPDRWLGFNMLRELVWSNASPNDLRIEQVRAIREWVERGGHLVIVLPAVGQDWLAVSNRELDEILPRVVVDRQENVPVAQFRNLLTDSDDIPIPATLVSAASFLTPRADAGPGEADIILNDAEGRGVVAGRTVGLGQVTLIGLPINSGNLRTAGMPEVDVFWHRVFGRRGQWAMRREMDALEADHAVNGRSRSPLLFDQDISSRIGKTGQSLAGVMLGMVVFITYWIVAGPGGFAVLKGKGQARHSWVGFLVASLLFTAIAWGGATVLRPKKVEFTHFSYLDHVYGQRIQRVRSWASVLAPVYGNATVGLDSDDADSGSTFVQAVSPWESNNAAIGAAQGSFPDARAYSVDSRSPQSMTFPARATVKQLQLDWAGGMGWDSIRPVTVGDEDPMAAVRRTSFRGRAALEGSLVHGFPDALDQVELVIFWEMTPLVPGPSQTQGIGGPLLTLNAQAIHVGRWEPGVVLDLAQQTIEAGAVSGLERHLDQFIDTRSDGLNVRSPTTTIEHLKWLSFFNLLPPPRYLNNGRIGRPTLAQRSATHGLDLSRWSTRPCIVIIGVLDASGEDALPAPVWIETNGQPRTIQTSGTTIVRWVYPLPPAPPAVESFPPPDEDDDGRI